MISIETALGILMNQPLRREAITLPLAEAVGHWLAAPVAAPFDLPPFDNSAMDGYAVCGMADSYEIIGEIAAGDTAAYVLAPGQALRIFTGGKVPETATAVVMQEHTRMEGHRLRLEKPLNEGQHIRRRGAELRQGQAVFAPGQPLNPAAIGVLGSLGLAEAQVFRKPRIRLIVTGNELVLPGQPRAEGQIFESNSYSLSAALAARGFACAEQQLIRDDFQEIQSGIARLLAESEVLILSGGISVGDYDYVHAALMANGVTELFYKVFQKPGKPLFAGRRGDTFVFALPGNPASSLTSFYIYVLPMLQYLSGAAEPGLLQLDLPLAHAYTSPFDRPAFLKARISAQQVHLLDGQGSSMIHSLAQANALALVEAGVSLGVGEGMRCWVV